MITSWLTHEGVWKSLTANEHIHRKGGSRRRLDSRQVNRWWHNELALVAAPCFELTAYPRGSQNPRILFTLFSITDKMHRPQ